MKKNHNLRATFLVAVVASLGISALIAIVALLFGDFGDIEEKLLMTTLIVGAYSLTGLCCSVLYEKRRFTALALSGMIVSVIGFLYAIPSVWGGDDFRSFEYAVSLFVLAVSMAHICLLLLIDSKKPLVNTALLITIFFISITALMLIMFIFMINGELDQSLFRLLGVSAILDVLGTIVSPILNKVYEK